MLELNVLEALLLVALTFSGLITFVSRRGMKLLREENEELRQEVHQQNVKKKVEEGLKIEEDERRYVHKLTTDLKRATDRFEVEVDEATKRQDLEALSNGLNEAFSQ